MTSKFKAIILLIVMFGLGVFTGVTCQKYGRHYGEPGHGPYAEHRLRRLKKQLNLTPPQEQSIRVIFQKAQERAAQVKKETSWDLADIHRDSVKAIRPELTPDQLRKFETLHQKYHTRRPDIPQDSESRPIDKNPL